MKRSKTVTRLAAEIEAGSRRLNELGKTLGDDPTVAEPYEALEREITLTLWRYFGANEEAHKMALERRKIRRAVRKAHP